VTRKFAAFVETNWLVGALPNAGPFDSAEVRFAQDDRSLVDMELRGGTLADYA
jgi:hypothetical protein